MINLLGLATSYIYIIVMVAVFGLMIAMTIIPQRKQKKQQNEMMNSLSSGDKIMTIGGMVGSIVAIDAANNQITVNVGSESAPVNIVIIKNAIRTKLTGTGATEAPVKAEEPKEEVKEDILAATEKVEEKPQIKTAKTSKAKKKTEEVEEKKEEDLTF